MYQQFRDLAKNLDGLSKEEQKNVLKERRDAMLDAQLSKNIYLHFFSAILMLLLVTPVAILATWMVINGLHLFQAYIFIVCAWLTILLLVAYVAWVWRLIKNRSSKNTAK
jgi:sterol desaturase/sphingolipid hydroxylase (fatty acid hydroxylase superfamily)